MRRFCVTVLLAALAVALSTPAEAQQRTVVKVGVPGRADQYNFEIALRRGYFAEQGLDVQTVQANSAQEFVSAIAANQIQVASGSPNAGLFNALNAGIDIKMVADWAHLREGPGRDSVAIVVRADLHDSGQVTKLEDLKGRTIAAGPGRAMYPDLLNEKIFKLAKLNPSDVTVRYLAFADSLAAMASKQVDAAFMVEPLITTANKQNLARVLAGARAIDPGGQLAVLMYSGPFAKQTDTATKFMVGFLKGVRDYYASFYEGKNKDDTIKLLTTYLPVKDPKLWEDATPGTADLNGTINIASLKEQAQFFKQQGTLTGAVPDMDKYVDMRFAEAAVKVIGRR
jgi:NitT/TauT family transport system substrate-binding protein